MKNQTNERYLHIGCGMECETCDKKNDEIGEQKKEEERRKTLREREKSIVNSCVQKYLFWLVSALFARPFAWYSFGIVPSPLFVRKNQFTFLFLFIFSLRHIPSVHTEYCIHCNEFGLCFFLSFFMCVCAFFAPFRPIRLSVVARCKRVRVCVGGEMSHWLGTKAAADTAMRTHNNLSIFYLIPIITVIILSTFLPDEGALTSYTSGDKCALKSVGHTLRNCLFVATILFFFSPSPSCGMNGRSDDAISDIDMKTAFNSWLRWLWWATRFASVSVT